MPDVDGAGGEIPRQQRERIVDALEDVREDLEAVATSGGPFSERAQNALDWLDERTEEPQEAVADA